VVTTLALALLLQAAQAPGFAVSGDLLEVTPAAGGVELLLRTPEARLFRCRLDSQSVREDGAEFGLHTGDTVEWASGLGEHGCRVERIRMLSQVSRQRPPASPYRLRLNLNPTDSLIRRGNLSLSGLVVRASTDWLLLRTRQGERLRIRLREDTHFRSSGLKATWSDVPLNQSVYVRAGKDLEGKLEAFQVAWGQILLPGPPPIPVETGRGPAAVSPSKR
jgi:hypothetical protein